MFFEFESNSFTPNNEQNPSKSTNDSSLSPTTSPIRGVSRNHRKSLPIAKVSPLIASSRDFPSSKNDNLNQQFRSRRNSMHSGDIHFPLETLKDNSLCDLALITRKKLHNLNNSTGSIKSLEKEFVEPDIKLNPSLTKNNNNDLRKEVLLASIQRSLSASTEDLHSLSLHKNNSSTLNQSNTAFNNVDDSIANDDTQMELTFSSTCMDRSNKPMTASLENITMLIDQSGDLRNPNSSSPKLNNDETKSQNHLSGSYTPSETHVNCKLICSILKPSGNLINLSFSVNSRTTFTSTTSVAGCKNQNNNQSLTNCRKFLKSNTNSSNYSGLSANNLGNYYSSRNSSQNLTCTVQSSPLRSSLKKRIYSTSPSKYSSPYHTVANSVNCGKEFHCFSNSSVHSCNHSHSDLNPIVNCNNHSDMNAFVTDWESAFKRLKVMHNTESLDTIGDRISDFNRNESETNPLEHINSSISNNLNLTKNLMN
ncbi:hypothetical protein SSS_10640 [Sarcoptes scabiei]|uniref:Uncharacterized protein n=1 Tax=Sarcoptes scabiei TaxID=52283 RepID=A0A834V8Y0_SARSC|nr:hypothetical protein SSS_10640 [Sarcoptes scabiei]